MGELKAVNGEICDIPHGSKLVLPHCESHVTNRSRYPQCHTSLSCGSAVYQPYLLHYHTAAMVSGGIRRHRQVELTVWPLRDVVVIYKYNLLIYVTNSVRDHFLRNCSRLNATYDDNPSLVEVLACCRNKPLPEPMLTQIYGILSLAIIELTLRYYYFTRNQIIQSMKSRQKLLSNFVEYAHFRPPLRWRWWG